MVTTALRVMQAVTDIETELIDSRLGASTGDGPEVNKATRVLGCDRGLRGWGRMEGSREEVAGCRSADTGVA